MPKVGLSAASLLGPQVAFRTKCFGGWGWAEDDDKEDSGVFCFCSLSPKCSWGQASHPEGQG